jgi:hypothetical protein
MLYVYFGSLGVMVCLLLGPRFSGSNPAEDDGFLRAIKFQSILSFGGEVKPETPCRKILRHVKDPLRYERY